MRLSEKLAALLAVAAILPLILASLLVLYAISSVTRNDASRRLQTDARVAASIYEKRMAEMRSAAQRLANDIANRAFVNAASAEGDRSAVSRIVLDMLATAQQELSMDFLIVTDPQGRVYVRHNNLPEQGETLLDPNDKNPIAERVIAEASQLRSTTVAGCVIERGQRLVQLGLDKRARVGDVEEALTVEAAAPIFGAGRFLGLVLIGQLLNNSHAAPPNAASLQLPLEEEIQQTLFPKTDKDTGEIDTKKSGAVIAVGNRVIASSLPASGKPDAPSGGALLGAYCDSTSVEETLQDGGAVYVVAWHGLNSLDQSKIAALGVAVPQSSFVKPVSAVRTTLIVVTALALALAAAAGFLFGRSLSERMKTLSAAANRMGLGELSTPVKDSARPGWLNRDEVASLAEELDRMRESFRQAIDRLRKR